MFSHDAAVVASEVLVVLQKERVMTRRLGTNSTEQNDKRGKVVAFLLIFAIYISSSALYECQ